METTTVAEPALHALPRLGFLGIGWTGQHRLKAIAQSGLAEIVGIADPSPEAVRTGAAAVPGAQPVATLDELLAQGLDGLVVATPSALHAEQSIHALERGVAVFCLQPLGRTAHETRSVINTARAADRLLGVDLSYRYTDAMRVLRPVVQAGELGEVYAVDVVFHSAHGPDRGRARDSRLAGGGCVIDLGMHVVDLALWTLGFPRVTKVTSRRYARGELLGPSRADVAEDYATALLELDTGATIRLSCSWGLPAGQDAIIEATFYGTEGGGSFRNVGGSFHDFTAELYRGTHRHTLATPPDNWGGRAELDWVRRLGAGERYDPWIEGLIDVAAALDAVLAR